MSEKYPLLTFTVMKNEGPFLVEWVAYQRIFGSDHILVMSNDCEDGTDLMLDRLMQMGHITHVPNPCMMGPKMIGKARHPHILAMEYAKHFQIWKDAGWVMMCDTDEFPDVYVGDGSFDALMDAAGAPQILSLCEKLFGADEHIRYDERLQTERFSRCSSSRPGKWRASRGIKSICRVDPRINIRNHRPLLQAEDANQIDWRDGAGNPFPEEMRTEHIKGLDCRGRYEFGAINHYVLRSMESFLVKVDRGDAVRMEDDQIDYMYFKKRNKVDEVNTHIHRMLPRLKEEIASLLDDPILGPLHWQAIRHHRNKIIKLHQDPRFAELFGRIMERIEATRELKRSKNEEGVPPEGAALEI